MANQSQFFFFFLFPFLLSNPSNAFDCRDTIVPTMEHHSDRFGFQLFQDDNWPDISTSFIAPTPDYPLAIRDKISIQIIGRSQASFIFTIDEEGFISPNLMPKIFLAGLTFSQAKNVLYAHFSRYYTFVSGQFLVSLIPSGKIKVYVLGNVRKEGLVEVPAQSNLFHAIMAAGGPTALASLRNIKIIRQGKESRFDAYAFSLHPNGNVPMLLSDMDIIHLPLSKKVISLQGAVGRPLKYEIADGECLKEILYFAGGLLPSANRQIAQLFRYAGALREQKDIYLPDYLEGKLCFDFQNGDSLLIKDISKWSPKVVKISGAILFPGLYDLDSNLTIKKLLQKAVLSDGAKLSQLTLLRKDENMASRLLQFPLLNNGEWNDFTLNAGDELIIDFKEKYKEEFVIEVSGNVKAPFVRSFPPGKQLHVSEAIILAGGLASGAADKAYIFRTNPDTPQKTIYLPLDLHDITVHPFSSSDIWLESGDKLFIPDKTFQYFPTQIGIYGAVKFPQEFKYDPSLKIHDLFRLSGGITDGADVKHVEIFRNTEKDNKSTLVKIVKEVTDSFTFKDEVGEWQLMPGDKIIVRNKKNQYATKMVFLSGHIQQSGIHPSDKQPYFLSDLISDAGGLTVNSLILHGRLIRNGKGRIEQPFNLHNALTFPGDLTHDLILQDNDSVYIEENNNMIILEVHDYKQFGMDSSMRLLPIGFKGNYGVKWYLNQFGGPILKAKVNGTATISRRTGELMSATLKGLSRNELKVMSGDLISIKAEEKPEIQAKKEIDWGKITDRILGISTTLSLFLVYLNR
jgi:protein involved in polysaccharide export with SLBB domain